MNKLSADKKVQVVAALVEGCSVRSVARLTGVAKSTILRLFAEVGTACADYQNMALRNVPAKRIQIDEIWSFVGAKQKNVTPEMAAERFCGDAWTFVAIDADTKLVLSWQVGSRDTAAATDFLQDVAGRLANRVQLTTDGHNMYLKAVADTLFENGIDFAQLVKYYDNTPEGQKRYSPAQCMGCKKTSILGDPDPKHISTSYIERQNLTMRMNMRRFTRLTNGFSKNIENHMHMVALNYMYYNFVRVHQTLKTTPAVAAGVSAKPWTLADVVELAEIREQVAA